jgi:tryptophan synthase beta chain
MLGGAQIYLKREDLNHTGAHKINNTIGQALLARRMGKKRVIAETGAGQHGVASATVAARYGMECVVYMGAEDIKRQSPNVFRMKLLGATVVGVESGSKTLKDALNEAMRDWVTNVESTFYILGTAAGPHPYPDAGARFPVRHRRRMQGADGRDARPPAGCGDRLRRRRLQRHRHLPPLYFGRRCAPDRRRSRWHGIASGKHAAPLSAGTPGVLHGFRSYLMQDANGQIIETHSVSAGLDYPGVGPEHSYLKDIGRAEYVAINDDEALAAFHNLCRYEGIIPALESSHALAHAAKIAPTMARTRFCWSTCPGAATRTSIPWRS